MSSNPMRKQNVFKVLADLQEDADYKALTGPVADAHCHDFRREVEILAILCVQTLPREAGVQEIRDRLIRLAGLARAPLAPLRGFIEHALAIIEGRANAIPQLAPDSVKFSHRGRLYHLVPAGGERVNLYSIRRGGPEAGEVTTIDAGPAPTWPPAPEASIVSRARSALDSLVSA